MRLPVLLVSVLVLPARLGGGGGAAPDDRTAIAFPTRGGVPAWKVRAIRRRRERALALDLGASSTLSLGGATRAAVGPPAGRPCLPASDRFRDTRYDTPQNEMPLQQNPHQLLEDLVGRDHGEQERSERYQSD